MDIAIKALSPAINDPTTAVQALDQIEDLLLRLGNRQLEVGGYRDEDGTVRLVVPFPSWDDLLRLAFDEISFFGATSVQVMRRMNALVADLSAAVPDDRRTGLAYWDQRLKAIIARTYAGGGGAPRSHAGRPAGPRRAARAGASSRRGAGATGDSDRGTK